jgi:hypothetical protein
MKLIASAVLIAVLFVAGCKSGPSLDGKWNMTGGSMGQMPPGSTATMEFSGGKMTMVMVGKDDQTGELGITANGTYELKETTLTMKVTDVKLDTSKVKAEVKPMIEQFLKPETFKEQLNKDTEFKVTFVSDKEVTLASKGGTTTLKK